MGPEGAEGLPDNVEDEAHACITLYEGGDAIAPEFRGDPETWDLRTLSPEPAFDGSSPQTNPAEVGRSGSDGRFSIFVSNRARVGYSLAG